jgi:hypothetical protein
MWDWKDVSHRDHREHRKKRLRAEIRISIEVLCDLCGLARKTVSRRGAKNAEKIASR